MDSTSNRKIPTLRFKDDQGNEYSVWESKDFSSIAERVKDSYRPDNQESVICIELENLESETGTLIQTSTTSERKSAKTRFQAGDVLFGKLRPYLKKYYLPNFSGVCTTEIWVLRPISVESKFLHFVVQGSQFFRAANYQFGSKMPRSDWRIVSQMGIRLPSCVQEQQKIASFLSSIDTRIEQLEKKKSLLEQYKIGLMQKLFSQEIRFKEKGGNNYPDWNKKNLGSIGKFKSGIGFPHSEQGGTEGIPFYKVSDMNLQSNENEMAISNNYVSEDQVEKLKYKPIKGAAIIFAKVGAAIFLERKRIAQNFMIDNNMMAYVPTKNLLFMKHVLDNMRLSKYVQTGALPSYNQRDLENIRVAIPASQEEQQKIAEFLSLIDKKIELVSEQIDKTREFKKGLLQQMFV